MKAHMLLMFCGAVWCISCSECEHNQTEPSSVRALSGSLRNDGGVGQRDGAVSVGELKITNKQIRQKLGPPLSAKAQALAESLGEAAAELTDDPCEQSFNTLKALARVAHRAIPMRADYMQACGELSPEMQRCLIPAYRAEHEAQCLQARNQTDPSILERLRRTIEANSP